MIKLSLKTKTILGIALIEGLLLLLLIYIATAFFADTLNDNFRKRANTTVKLFATLSKDAVLSYDLASLQSYAEELKSNPDVAYVKIYGPLPNEPMFVELGDPEFIQKEFIEDFSVLEVDDGIFDVSHRVTQVDQAFGRVQIGFYVNPLINSVQQLKRWAGTIALIEIILVALFSYALGTYLTMRLKRLEFATKKATQGTLTGRYEPAKLDVTNDDEIATVSKAFNELLDALEEAEKNNRAYKSELQNMNLNLENTVNERTEKLQKANEELKSSYQYVQEAQQQLVQSEKMASMGQLAASLAHEINNPIAFIQTNVESMQTYLELVEAQQILISNLIASQESNRDSQLAVLSRFISENQLIEEISDANNILVELKIGVKRVVDVIRNMSSFSRVDKESKQYFNINQCIESTYHMTQKQVSEKGTLICKTNNTPDVYINVGKINQVLTNLVLNAFDAIDKGGTIVITSEVVGEDIVIAVQDDGEGIDQKYQDKVFDPFFTTKEEGKGTGLGLSISYDIIKSHNGQLNFSSRMGKGTRVEFTIPVSNTNA